MYSSSPDSPSQKAGRSGNERGRVGAGKIGNSFSVSASLSQLGLKVLLSPGLWAIADSDEYPSTPRKLRRENKNGNSLHVRNVQRILSIPRLV